MFVKTKGLILVAWYLKSFVIDVLMASDILTGSWSGLVSPLLVACGGVLVIYVLPRLWAFLQAVRRCRRITACLQDIPCPVSRRHWLLGSMADHPGPTHRLFTTLSDWTAKYPKLYALDYGSISRYVVVNDPATAEYVLKNSEEKILKSFGWNYRPFLPWQGQGPFLCSWQVWVRLHRLLAPAFTSQAMLKSYVHRFNTCADRFMDHLTSSFPGGQPVPIFSNIAMCSLSIVLQCAFSFTGDVYQTNGRAFCLARL